MENLVPLGTGNSRLMKSNISSNTTLAQLIQMWNNGTFPYDIGPLNSAGISQQGTPLNKDTLLKDATAALFGLGSDAVPDDVLAKLAEAAFVEDGAVTDIDGNIVGPQIVTGSYVGTGKYGSSNPNSLTFDFAPKVLILMLATEPTGDTYDVVYFGIYSAGETSLWALSGNPDRTSNTEPYLGNVASASNNTISWYAPNYAYSQFNRSNWKYRYIAIG